MTACDFIDQLYEEIQNSYIGVEPNFDNVIINEEVITSITNPVIDNTYTTNCTLFVDTDACKLEIKIL